MYGRKRYRDAGDAPIAFRRRLFGGGYRRGGFKPFNQTNRSQIWQLKKQLRQGSMPLIPAEKKFVDIGNTSNLVASTDWTGGEEDDATMLCLNGVAQGAGNSQRVGMKYAIHSIQINGAFFVDSEINQTAADAALQASASLVWDKQTNAAQLNSEDVFNNTSGIATAQACQNGMRNMSFTKRFKVLKTAKCVLKPPTLSWDGTNMEQGGDANEFQWFVEFKRPVIVECSGTGATVASIMNHSFHMIGHATSTQAQLVYTSRIRYSDV